MDDIVMWFTPEQAQTLGSSDPIVRAMVQVYIDRAHKRAQEEFGHSVLADLEALPIIHVIDTQACSELLS